MLNIRKCFFESRVEIQKRLESHPDTKKMGIFRRPRSASLGDIPKKQAKGEKKAAPSAPEEKTPERGKGVSSPACAQVAKSQVSTEKGDWLVVTRKSKKEKKKKRRRRRTLCKKHTELSPNRG